MSEVKRQFNKIFANLLFATTVLCITLLPWPVTADSVGSSVMNIDTRIHVDAKLVNTPSETIRSNSQRPVLFGHTLQNVTIQLFSDGAPLGTTNSDDTGYWRFAPIKNLKPGSHLLTMQLTDPQGVSGEIIPIATVRIPVEEIKPSYGIPIPPVPLNQINYVTVSLLMLASTIAGVAAYLLARKRYKHGVKP